jgi:hypothetical protein
MVTLSKQQMDAAQEFANATVSALKLAQGVHPPTLVAATARMAGTYLFRSLGLDVPGVSLGQATAPHNTRTCDADQVSTMRTKPVSPPCKAEEARGLYQAPL